MSRRGGRWALAFRWFSGAPLDGQYRTNAGWLHHSYGERPVLHPTGRAMWWHHKAWLLRGVIRSAATVAVPVVLSGLVVARTVTLSALAAALLAVLAVAGWRLWRLLRQWNHRRRYVRPALRAFTRELGAPPRRLEIEPDRSKVTVWFEDEFTGTPREREAVLRVIATKVGLLDPDDEWLLTGKKPRAVCTRSEPPPARVELAAIRAAIEAASEHEVVMGIGPKDQVTVISVDNDSPHVGLSMGSGDGKSVTARNMAAQLAYHGALVIVLDYKLISHMWARGLPNVGYAGTSAEIEQMMVWLAAEVTRRNKVALAGADIEGRVHANVGPRIFVICEELNATQNRLKSWWNREMGEKGRSPGSEALDEVMFLGRQVLVNVLQIGQRLSVKATGSGDARENLGVLVFADPTASAWKMLVGDRHAMPPATGHKGRLQVVTKKTVWETQGALLSGAQARELAVAGKVALPPAEMPCVTTAAPVAVGVGHPPLNATEGPDQAFVVGQPPAVPSIPGAITLREAAAAGLFTSKEAAHKAVLRAGLASVGDRGAAKLYLVEELASCQPRKAARR